MVADGDVALHRLCFAILIYVMSVRGVEADVPSVHVTIADVDVGRTTKIAVTVTPEVGTNGHSPTINNESGTPRHIHNVTHNQSTTILYAYKTPAIRLSYGAVKSQDQHAMAQWLKKLHTSPRHTLHPDSRVYEYWYMPCLPPW